MSAHFSKALCRLLPSEFSKAQQVISFSLGQPESHLIPESIFKSSWLHPVLSAASNYKLGRVLRLAARIVICAEFNDEKALQSVEHFFSTLELFRAGEQ